MYKEMREIAIKMNILMGISMSLILSLVGTLMSGHFSFPAWRSSFMISFVIAMFIGFVVPIKKTSDIVCEKCKVDPESKKSNLLRALISDLVYTPIITILMEIIMLNNAAKNAPAGAVPPLAKVLPGSLAICFIIGFVVIAIIQPLFLNMLLNKRKGL